MTVGFSPFLPRHLIAWNHRKWLLSLAAQKFVSDIAADAYQHARIRTRLSHLSHPPHGLQLVI